MSLTRARPQTIGKAALLAVVLTIGLIAYGAWVRVSGSGLGCPDWPLCNGQVVPTDRAATIESGHRWYAGITMLTVFATAFMGFRQRREFPKAAALLTISAVLILVQALLGAAVVLTELHPLIRLVHLSLAMTIIATLAIAAIGLLQGRDPALTLRRQGWPLLPAAIAVILVGGSIVATANSYECAALPLCDRESSPLATGLHSAHRVLGALTMLATAVLALNCWRKDDTGALFKVCVLVSLLLITQIGVGVSAVVLTLPTGLRVLHIGLAASIWAGLVAAWSLAAQSPAVNPLIHLGPERPPARPPVETDDGKGGRDDAIPGPHARR